MKDEDLASSLPLGAEDRFPRVLATSRFIGMKGKLYAFEVSASDPGGEIGTGMHDRAIVLTERLLDGARRRAA